MPPRPPNLPRLQNLKSKPMSEKITGYLLLSLGLAAMLLSAFSIYSVFTKKARPIDLFTSPGIIFQNTELIPASSLNDISNLSAHYFLMSFLLSVGFKVSSLGIQLLRPVEIKLNSKESQPPR